MSNIIVNKNHDINSLQISILLTPTTGSKFTLNSGFLIKNITEETINLEVKLLGSNTYITTPFYEGWNPEIVKEIKNVPEGIQIGY